MKKPHEPSPGDGQRAPAPGVTKQIRRLLREVYPAWCDIEELKAMCDVDDEQLLKRLEYMRQHRIVVAANAPPGLLPRVLSSLSPRLWGAAEGARHGSTDAVPGAPPNTQDLAPQPAKKARSGFKVNVANELVAKGLGRREATRAVKAIIDAMKDAVQRGEVVETPFGTLRRVQVRRRPRLGKPFGGKLKWMHPKPHWRIVFRPFPKDRE
jgi:hypothetical protein